MGLSNVYVLMSNSKALLALIMTIAAALLNMVFVQSEWIGIIALIAYFSLMGLVLGGALLTGEQGAFMRFMFGTFLSVAFLILTGLAVNMVYTLNFLSLSGMLVAPLFLLVFRRIWRILRRHPREKVAGSVDVERAPVFSPFFVVPLVLIVYCFYLVVQARSGWVNGTVWTVVSPSFFYVYFFAALSLVLVIFLCEAKSASKLSVIIVFSVLSTTVWSIVLYPGNAGDPLGHMGFANMIYSYGSWRPSYHPIFLIYWLIKGKGLAALTASAAKISTADVYWIHTFGTPILWGIFIPLTTYRITKMIGGNERASILAAFLSTFYGFVSWGARASANALGLVLFMVSLYFALRHLKSGKSKTYLLLALFTAIVSGVSHPLTGIMSFVSIFLVIAFRLHEAMKLKSLREARLLLAISFLICALLLPVIFLVNGLLYVHFAPPHARSAYIELATAFSMGKLLDTDLWSWIFGGYMDLDFKGVLHSVVVPFLGLVGMGYVLKNGDKKSRVPALLLTMAFLIYFVDNRILQYTMVNILFGASRVLVFQDLVAIPFAALVFSLCFRALGVGVLRNPSRVLSVFRGLWVRFSIKQVFALFLVGISLSAYAVSSIERTYEWLGGLQPTELEVEAVKYIDKHTTGKYVVVTMPTTAAIGWGFMGTWNPEKWYVFEKGNYLVGSNPSVSTMFDYMQGQGAGVGYFIASSFRTPNYAQVVQEASRIFGQFAVLSNEHGEIQIFEYKVAPLPTGPDVMAFWWDSPSAYFIQNNRMRVIINPETRTIEVSDFWGDRYESLNLNTTLLNGESLGNLLSVDYFDSESNLWITWDAGQDVIPNPALSTQFEFRMNFPKGSLVGIIQQDSSSIPLRWESVGISTLHFHLGEFSRLYMPGLVEGAEAYNVSARDFGLFYTVSRTENVTLHPIYDYEVGRYALGYSDVVSYCNLTLSKGYVWYSHFSYEFGVKNNALFDDWAFVEVWLPDEVYMKTFPPLAYSTDGGTTWTEDLPYSRDPLRTIGGVDANWIISNAGSANSAPEQYVYSTKGVGGFPPLPGNFTSSGGSQNRIILGVYLPAGDEILWRIGTSLYYVEPQKITYWFTDSSDENYGLRNLQKGLVASYNVGSSEYIGGLRFSTDPLWLAVKENAGAIEEITIAISAESTILLLSGREIDTLADQNGNGVPDSVEDI